MSRYYLCIGAFFRDETPYLDEWLRFHLAQGVEHFFLYDHLSVDNPTARLAPYIERGLVTLTDWRVEEKRAAQMSAYDHCLATHGPQARWIAFIDLDEFLFSPEEPLPEVLKEFEAFPGVFVNWHCYGSSGHRERPAGPVTGSYLRRAPSQWARNRQGKSIVDPRRARKSLGPHYFTYADDGQAVNEAKRPLTWRPRPELPRRLSRVVGRWAPWLGHRLPVDPYAYAGVDARVSARRLRINHYSVKSAAEYQEKMAKNNKSKVNKGRYDDAFFRYHDRNEVLDPVLADRAAAWS